ncbi:MAG TPA: ATP-binding protein [Pseudomonadales bacterium]|nr:ATP-binding protein [Pseudomonadales bacterium]
MSDGPAADAAPGQAAAGAPLSIRARLLLAAGLVLIGFLSLTGFVLDRAFQASIEDSAREQLRIRALGLLGIAELVDGVLSLPPSLPEPLFNQPGSGLYARLIDRDGVPVWISRSLASRGDAEAPGETLAPGEAAFDTRPGADGEGLYRYGFGVLWEGPTGDAPYSIWVTTAQAPFIAETRGFRRTLYTLLGGAGVGLLLMLLLVLAVALAPLRRVETELERVERGEAARLHGVWPEELAGLTRNLNLLIDHERARQQRYRNTLDDLAHSLKTPLAILRNALADADPRGLADAQGQIDRMDAIVGHHLHRASVGRNPLGATGIALAEPVRRIVDGLRRLHGHRGLTIETDVPATLAVAVDERDLYEIVGNLTENACKYGDARVRLWARADGAEVCLRVEDDGPGVPAALRSFVLDRGARADTATSGQGIGLAVVAELVAAYEGSVEIGSAALGGACIEVWLPMAGPRAGSESAAAPGSGSGSRPHSSSVRMSRD